MSCRATLGTNIAATAVDLFAKCTLENMLYGDWKTSANVNMLSQVKLSHQVAAHAYMKSEGQKQEFGGLSQYRVSKSLDYAGDWWFGFILPQVRIKCDRTINRLASLRYKKNWAALLPGRTRLLVQDLLLSEADTFASIIHNHAFVSKEHRELIDILSGNTQDFLSPGSWNPATQCFDVVGAQHYIYTRLPVFPVKSGHNARPFITGAAVFNDIRLEIEANNFGDLIELTNGPCGTAAIDASPNGRAATLADVETCNGECPQIIDSHVIVDGAVGTPEEKKALARMVSTNALKLYSYTNYEQFNPFGDTVMTLRLSLALVGIHFAVVNVTHGRVSNNFSTVTPHSHTTWKCAELRFENTVRHTFSPQMSLISSVSYSSTDSNQVPYVGFFPASFDTPSAHITSSLQASRVSDMVFYISASEEAQMASEGYFPDGTPIPFPAGSSACVDGVQDPALPGQKQRYQAAAVAEQVALIKHVRASVQMVV